MPRALIRELSVVGGIPRSLAAPFSPEIRHFVSSSARTMLSLSKSWSSFKVRTVFTESPEAFLADERAISAFSGRARSRFNTPPV